MRHAMDYFYTDGRRTVPIARLFHEDSRITWEVLPGCAEVPFPGFCREKIVEHLQHIIHLPLLQSELRARTVPQQFHALAPHSLEHFYEIARDTTYFKFGPVRAEQVSASHLANAG
jgi:hypothetical protein